MTETTDDPSTDIARLEAGIDDALRHVDVLRAELRTAKSQLKILLPSCGKYFSVQDLEAIQTHWYVDPHGCSGGDYWKAGEMHVVCPETGIRNRLLFNKSKLDWRQRDRCKYDPEVQFRQTYGPLFRLLLNEHEHTGRYKWVNCYYVDHNRAKFGLTEPRHD